MNWYLVHDRIKLTPIIRGISTDFTPKVTYQPSIWPQSGTDSGVEVRGCEINVVIKIGYCRHNQSLKITET